MFVRSGFGGPSHAHGAPEIRIVGPARCPRPRPTVLPTSGHFSNPPSSSFSLNMAPESTGPQRLSSRVPSSVLGTDSRQGSRAADLGQHLGCAPSLPCAPAWLPARPPVPVALPSLSSSLLTPRPPSSRVCPPLPPGHRDFPSLPREKLRCRSVGHWPHCPGRAPFSLARSWALVHRHQGTQMWPKGVRTLLPVPHALLGPCQSPMEM